MISDQNDTSGSHHKADLHATLHLFRQIPIFVACNEGGFPERILVDVI